LRHFRWRCDVAGIRSSAYRVAAITDCIGRAVVFGREGRGGAVTAGDAPARGLAGIVLAAGGASRFGSVKQLAEFGTTSLVVRAGRLALAVCPAGAVVVTGAHAAAVESALAGLPLATARNVSWAEGMAGSLRCGLGALPTAADACLVLLCDQPAVDEDDLRRLVDAWSGAPEQPAAAGFSGTVGVPAIFPAAFWDALARLQGDRGARELLAATRPVTVVAMPHAAFDVDTRADLDRLGP
jgi:molybdenum cofactor cytidylyltransferase